MKLTIEKDFQCLDQRPNENDSDAFNRALFAAAGITADDFT
jgi:hypothetical protein